MVKTYSTRTRKHLHIVAYDIANDKRRNKLAKLLEQFGHRINYSVFECMLTPTQRKDVEKEIQAIINTKKDQVTIYRICVDCYTKTTYFPPQTTNSGVVVVS